MKILILYLVLVISLVIAQTKLILNPEMGMYTHHSENGSDLLNINDVKFKYFEQIPSLTLKTIFFELPFEFSYAYQNTSKKIATTLITDYFGNNNSIPINMSYKLNIIEIGYEYQFEELNYFFINFGPSAAFVKRSIEIEADNLNESISSIAIGAYLKLSLEFPLKNNLENIVLTTGLKTRYLKSIYYYENNRNLGDYKQEMLFESLFLGLGYTF